MICKIGLDTQELKLSRNLVSSFCVIFTSQQTLSASQFVMLFGPMESRVSDSFNLIYLSLDTPITRILEISYRGTMPLADCLAKLPATFSQQHTRFCQTPYVEHAAVSP